MIYVFGAGFGHILIKDQQNWEKLSFVAVKTYRLEAVRGEGHLDSIVNIKHVNLLVQVCAFGTESEPPTLRTAFCFILRVHTAYGRILALRNV